MEGRRVRVSVCLCDFNEKKRKGRDRGYHLVLYFHQHNIMDRRCHHLFHFLALLSFAIVKIIVFWEDE